MIFFFFFFFYKCQKINLWLNWFESRTEKCFDLTDCWTHRCCFYITLLTADILQNIWSLWGQWENHWWCIVNFNTYSIGINDKCLPYVNVAKLVTPYIKRLHSNSPQSYLDFLQTFIWKRSKNTHNVKVEGTFLFYSHCVDATWTGPRDRRGLSCYWCLFTFIHSKKFCQFLIILLFRYQYQYRKCLRYCPKCGIG